MGTRTLAIQNTYAMLFVVVFLGLQATAAFATPLEQERFFDLEQERFFDLCEKITAITTKDGKGWIHPIKDWICGTTTSTLPSTTTTTEEVTTTTSTIPPTTTTEEVTKEKDCAAGWKQFQDRCFYFGGTDVVKGFTSAELKCKSLNPSAHLASILSPEEHNWITGIMGDTGDLHASFIGFSDAKKEGNWEWVDGSPTNYTNWAQEWVRQPDNWRGNEDCAYLWTTSKNHPYWINTWVDGNCAGTGGYIRSYNKHATLAPPTGGRCYAIGEHAGIVGWNMWCQVNCNQVPITNCPADQCACQKS